MKEIKAYLCDFCPRRKRAFQAKGSATRHEQNCFFNPARKACATCKNFVRHEGKGEDYEERYCLVDIYIGHEIRIVDAQGTEEGGLQFDCPKWEAKGV